jgi:hypothetical protein
MFELLVPRDGESFGCYIIRAGRWLAVATVGWLISWLLILWCASWFPASWGPWGRLGAGLAAVLVLVQAVRVIHRRVAVRGDDLMAQLTQAVRDDDPFAADRLVQEGQDEDPGWDWLFIATVLWIQRGQQEPPAPATWRQRLTRWLRIEHPKGLDS